MSVSESADRAGAQRPTLIYDGACVLCTRAVARVQRLDRAGRIEWLSSLSAEVGQRFPELSADALRRSMQFVRPGRPALEAGAAAEAVLLELERGGLAWAFRVPGFRQLFDRGYRAFAARRYRFGCSQHCGLPHNENGPGETPDP